MTAAQVDPDLLILRAAYPRGAQVPVVVRKRTRGGHHCRVDVFDPAVQVLLTKEVARLLGMGLMADGRLVVRTGSVPDMVGRLSRRLYDDPDSLTVRTI